MSARPSLPILPTLPATPAAPAAIARLTAPDAPDAPDVPAASRLAGTAAHATEALRQQLLLRAISRQAPPQAVLGWLRGTPARARRGLAAYQANAGAVAVRALTVAYPTVAQLVGEESMAALARAFHARHLPERGDLATWGEALAGFIAADPQLADTPYLADVARLDWALHEAAQAADDQAPAEGLALLASADPARLRLRLRAGWAVIVSPHPLHAIWAAHQAEGPADPSAQPPADPDDRFAAVRAAFAAGRADALRVRRASFQPVAERITPDVARFESALLAGQALAGALEAAGDGFDMADWLIDTLRRDGIAALHTEETLA